MKNGVYISLVIRNLPSVVSIELFVKYDGFCVKGLFDFF